MTQGLDVGVHFDDAAVGANHIRDLFRTRLILHLRRADAHGELGPVYGVQWRSWRGADGRTHDQIAAAVDLLARDPHSRRIIVNAWNVGELDRMAHVVRVLREQRGLQLAREPLPLPTLTIKRRADSIFDYRFEDFEIAGYQSHPAIKAPIAV